MRFYFKSLDKLQLNRAKLAFLDGEIPKLMDLAKALENDVDIATSRFGRKSKHRFTPTFTPTVFDSMYS